MYRKLWMVGVGVIFLSGCATMNQNRNAELQQLQNRISHLEMQLEKKDQEIAALESEISGKSKRAVGYSTRETIIDISDEPAQLSKTDIQKALKSAGFYEGPVDGKFGPKTKDAILAFQKENGLKIDGVVGRRTSAELKKYLSE